MTIDEYTLIADLFGKKRSETRPAESKTSTIVGVATSDSALGSVRVRLNSDLTGGEDGELVIPTDAHIVAGDIVSISLVGGTAKAPRVTGTVGGGDRIYASLVETNQLVATKADITDLTAAEGRIGTLEANALTASSAVITDLQADTAKVHELTANELSAATGYVGDLVAGNLTAANLISDHQTIGSLDVSQISADHATIASLDSNYAQIDLANIANGTIKTAMIDDGQITSAKILNGTIANADIANGTIENAKIKDGTIESAKIKDGTIQNADIANGTIETAKIHDGAITNAKIADATIDSAKITNLTGANGWIDRLMVQTGLIANDGTVFTLDAIKVNAASITAGTIDIERIVVTDSTTGDKHMVTWDSENEEWDAVKLDGDVLGDRTIAADKIVAHDITVQEITTENLVGTGGWINLAAGTFQYVNATSGDGISWDGTNLTINAGSLMTTISNTYATQTALANETNARKAVYGTSSTGATTQTKAVTCSNFTRYTGAEVTVKFGNANTYNGAPKLNVNSTGAAEIRSYTGTALTKGEREWAAGSTLTFSFDGTYWRMLDNGMTGRMSTAESSITQNADKISLIVTDGSTSGNLSLTADAMTYIGNNVVIKDSTGSSTVITGGKLYTNLISVGDLSDGSSYSTTSQMNTAISTAVDNIDVGGRNLLRFTSRPTYIGESSLYTEGSAPTGWYAYSVNSNVSVARTSDGIKMTSDRNAANGLVIPLCSEGVIESDQEYTLSFTYRCTGTFYNRSVFLLGRDGNVYTIHDSSEFDMTGEWATFKRTYTWTIAEGNNAYALLIPYFRYFEFEVKDGSMKLERGNVATDWTPAPEDMDDTVVAVQQIYIQASSVSNAPTVPSAWVEESGESITYGTQDDASTITTSWTVKHPTYDRNRPVTFVATQRKRLDGTITCSNPLPDDTNTVIDGGRIITNSIQAHAIESNSLKLSNFNSEVTDKFGSYDTAVDNVSSLSDNVSSLSGQMATFEAVEQRVASHDGQLTTIMNSLKFAEGELELKTQSGDDSTSVALTSEKMEFRANGTEVAYVSNEKLYIRNAQVLDNMQMGGFAWIPRSNGNLSLKWLGGVSHMNLLRGTGNIVAADYVLVRSTVTDGVIRLTPTTSGAYAKIKVDYLDYKDFDGSTFTFGVDAKLADVTSSYTNVNLCIYFGVNDSTRIANTLSSTYDRYMYAEFTDMSSEWARYTFAVTIPNNLDAGTTDVLAPGNYVTVQAFVSGSRKPVDVRNFKLEIGTEATPWSKNPND